MKYFKLACLIVSQYLLFYGVNEAMKTPYNIAPQNIAAWTVGLIIYGCVIGSIQVEAD